MLGTSSQLADYCVQMLQPLFLTLCGLAWAAGDAQLCGFLSGLSKKLPGQTKGK